jgi:hypothetical protein
MISPRLSTALIQQWIDRLCEVEMQNDPIEMRRTVREVLQHMNSMISPYWNDKLILDYNLPIYFHDV